jgi:mono/diheme cytochrome c family protein
LLILPFEDLLKGWAKSEEGRCDFLKGGKKMVLYPRWVKAAIVFSVFAVLWFWVQPAKSGDAPSGDTPKEEIARPSNPGGPGEAVNLTGDPKKGAEIFRLDCVGCHNLEGKGGFANPGSDDGTVPPLDPIDPTIYSKDYKTFATNLDLFIQHGSTPSGPDPGLIMPAWGDDKRLTQQQIADVIAYVISLNKK